MSSGNGRLHAIGELVVGDRRLERIMMADSAEHALVERSHKVELAQLVVWVTVPRADVRNRRPGRLEDRSLKGRR